MLRFVRGTILIGSLILGGCAKDSESKKENGNYCSGTTVNSYNEIIKGNSVESNCQTFQKSIGGSSCDAANEKTNAPMKLSYNDVKDKCEPNHQTFKPSTRNPNPSTPTPTTPDPEQNPHMNPEPENVKPLNTKKLSKSGKVLTFKVLNDDLLNQVIAIGPNEAFMQSGTPVVGVQSIKRGLPFCFVMTNPRNVVKNGDDFQIKVLQMNRKNVGLTTPSGNFQIGCGKLDATKEWMIKDLQEVFGATAEIDSAE